MGVLLIRAWTGPVGDGLRARVMSRLDIDGGEEHTTSVADVDAVCDAVRAWLAEFLAGDSIGGSPAGSVTGPP